MVQGSISARRSGDITQSRSAERKYAKHFPTLSKLADHGCRRCLPHRTKFGGPSIRNIDVAFSWRRMQSSGTQLAIGNARGTSACFSKSAEMLTSSYQSTGGSHKSTGTLPGRVMKCSRHECVMVQPCWCLFARRCTFSFAVLGLEPQEQYSPTRPRAGKRCNSTSPGIPRRSLIPVLVRPKQA